MDVLGAWKVGKDMPEALLGRSMSLPINYASFRALSFEELGDEMLLHNPHLAVARASILRQLSWTRGC